MKKVRDTSKDLRFPGASHSAAPSPSLGLKGQVTKKLHQELNCSNSTRGPSDRSCVFQQRNPAPPLTNSLGKVEARKIHILTYFPKSQRARKPTDIHNGLPARA